MDRVCPTRKQLIIVRFLKLLPSKDTMEFSIYMEYIDYILHSHIPSKRSSITILHIDSVPVVKVWIDLGVIGKKPSKSNGGRPGFGRAMQVGSCCGHSSLFHSYTTLLPQGEQSNFLTHCHSLPGYRSLQVSHPGTHAAP